jgi:hypothetical protein
MYGKVSVFAVPFLLLTFVVFSQGKSRSALKEEKKIETQTQIEDMVNAREFVFVARIALPQGYRAVNLTTNPNSVKFHPDLIESDMPFYGTAYSGIGYGGDSGMHFKGKPEDFTMVKGKKNFQVNVTVKGENDTFKLMLTISFEGSASLSIISNNRSTISYQGEISAPEKSK